LNFNPNFNHAVVDALLRPQDAPLWVVTRPERMKGAHGVEEKGGRSLLMRDGERGLLSKRGYSGLSKDFGVLEALWVEKEQDEQIKERISSLQERWRDS
jgi:hypothetical protein